MGVTWAITWVIAGLAIGVSTILVPALPWSAFFEVFDAPLPTLALPGFICGAIFSGVIGVLGKHRRFDQLSLPIFTAWGALGGVLLALVPQTMAVVGLATISDRYASPWTLTGIIVGPIALLSAASACVTLLIARRAETASAKAPPADDVPMMQADSDALPLTTGHGLDAIRRSLHDSQRTPADRHMR